MFFLFFLLLSFMLASVSSLCFESSREIMKISHPPTQSCYYLFLVIQNMSWLLICESELLKNIFMTEIVRDLGRGLMSTDHTV